MNKGITGRSKKNRKRNTPPTAGTISGAIKKCM